MAILGTLAPYHIICYGSLLGTTFFHSFINGFVQFKTLPRKMFSAVQNKLFPIYFSMQTALPVALALTFPGRGGSQAHPASLAGVLRAENRLGFLAPLVVTSLTALVNLVVLMPATRETMRLRFVQESKDGKQSNEPGPHSQEMLALNKKFGKLHGISTLLNLAGYLATIVYGVSLSARIQ